MRNLPLLSKTGVDDLLVSCKAGDPEWENPTSRGLYELAKRRNPENLESDGVPYPDLQPHLFRPHERDLLDPESCRTYRTDEEILRRWLLAGMNRHIPPAHAVDKRFFISVACFALAEYGRARYSRQRWNPARALLMESAGKSYLTQEQLYHTSAKFWWIVRLAELGTPFNFPSEALREEELLRRARILARHPKFTSMMAARTLTIANRKVTCAILTQIGNAETDEEEMGRLLESKTIVQWIQNVSIEGSARLLDVLDEDEIARIVRDATPPPSPRNRP